MRSLLVNFPAAGVLSWTPDQDVVITGGIGNTSSDVTVSTDPSLDISSTFFTDPFYFQLILFLNSSSFIPVSYPVAQGETVYFSADNLGLVFLTYDLPS